MSFLRSTVRRSSTDKIVHAVGQRVYVNGSGSGIEQVDLMNHLGTKALGRLEDGVEVMVMAWRPQGSTGTRYHVRCTGDGVEGWLAAANLRRARTLPLQLPAAGPPATSAPRTTASPARDPKLPFGRR